MVVVVQLIMKRAHRDTPWSAHASVSWGKATQPRGAGPVASPHELTDVILQVKHELEQSDLGVARASCCPGR